MSRIENRFRELRARNEAALIPFITAGYPDLESCRRIVLAIARAGADMIELGIPYSDPVADGTAIQAASGRALELGMDMKKFFGLVREVRREVDLPLIAMTYCNPVFVYGGERFTADALQSGLDGVIISDLPPEEGQEFLAGARQAGLDTILLVSPNTSPDRLPAITAEASGFVYCVARLGVTGVGGAMADELPRRLADLKRLTDKPLCVGFGISGVEHVRRAAALADGVIVGSALVQLLADETAGPRKASEFIAQLKAGTIREP